MCVSVLSWKHCPHIIFVCDFAALHVPSAHIAYTPHVPPECKINVMKTCRRITSCFLVQVGQTFAAHKKSTSFFNWRDKLPLPPSSSLCGLCGLSCCPRRGRDLQLSLSPDSSSVRVSKSSQTILNWWQRIKDLQSTVIRYKNLQCQMQTEWGKLQLQRCAVINKHYLPNLMMCLQSFFSRNHTQSPAHSHTLTHTHRARSTVCSFIRI